MDLNEERIMLMKMVMMDMITHICSSHSAKHIVITTAVTILHLE